MNEKSTYEMIGYLELLGQRIDKRRTEIFRLTLWRYAVPILFWNVLLFEMACLHYLVMSISPDLTMVGLGLLAFLFIVTVVAFFCVHREVRLCLREKINIQASENGFFFRLHGDVGRALAESEMENNLTEFELLKKRLSQVILFGS